MGAVSFFEASTAGGDLGIVAVSTPRRVRDGDVLIAVLVVDGSGVTLDDLDDGWTTEIEATHADGSLWVLSRIADGEPSRYTFTIGGGYATEPLCSVLLYRNLDGILPIVHSWSRTVLSFSGTTFQTPARTLNSIDDVYIGICFGNVGAAFTEGDAVARVNFEHPGNGSLLIVDKLPDATSTIAVTNTANNACTGLVASLALRARAPMRGAALPTTPGLALTAPHAPPVGAGGGADGEAGGGPPV